jgi:hypothetical protein
VFSGDAINEEENDQKGHEDGDESYLVEGIMVINVHLETGSIQRVLLAHVWFPRESSEGDATDGKPG